MKEIEVVTLPLFSEARIGAAKVLWKIHQLAHNTFSYLHALLQLSRKDCISFFYKGTCIIVNVVENAR